MKIEWKTAFKFCLNEKQFCEVIKTTFCLGFVFFFLIFKMSGTVPSSNHAFTYVRVMGDPAIKDELRLKAAQELGEHFEQITHCTGFKNFIDQSMKTFIKILQEDNIQFISEYNIQQVNLVEICKKNW